MEEKILNPKNGFTVLFLNIAVSLLSFMGMIANPVCYALFGYATVLFVFVLLINIVVFMCSMFVYAGLKMVNPNEALVLVLFGKYYGTIKSEGYFWVNPFVSAVNGHQKTPEEKVVELAAAKAGQVQTQNKKVSLKAITLTNRKQKINDKLGNPLEIGVMVIWKVKNPTLAVFAVDNYREFVSTQADSILRNVVRNYAYDVAATDDELTLRSSSTEIADILCAELQEKVIEAGIEVVEVKIIDMAYAPEIAASMLQRQQAAALLDAKKLIVEGAVGMVKMALDSLQEENVVNLDEERKATMVSNLLVVLCGNKDTQPIVNAGSLY